MAAGTTRSSHLAVVYASTECNHICGRSLRNGKIFGVTLWRLGRRLNDIAGRRRNIRTWRALWSGAGGVARVDDPINPSFDIVRHVERPVRSDCDSRGAMGGALRSLYRTGKTVGEDFAIPGGLITIERLKDYVVACLCVRGPIP